MRATYSNGSLRCTTPTSSQSGASREIVFSFDRALVNGSVVVGDGAPGWRVRGTLLGDASIPSELGALRLTSADYSQLGSFVTAPVDDTRPIRSFRASFALSRKQ